MGCSNGDIQVIKLHNDEEKMSKEIHQNYKLEDQTSTNVCLMHDSTANQMAGCYQDGSVALFDRETAKIQTFLPKTHQFEVWYTHFRSDNQSILYSCSDDCSFKSIDLRTCQVIQTCKKNDAGVTWLGTGNLIDSNQILTGGYDGVMKLWDDRNLKQGPIQELSFPGKSIWDIKYSIRDNGIFQMGFAGIYDGYFMCKLS